MRTQPTAIYLSMGTPHLEYPAVAAALAERGVTARLVHLDDIDAVDWSVVGLVNVRMCRGYHTDPGFLERLKRLNDQLQELPGGPVPMANSINLIRDAVDKSRYLPLLAADGIDVIPTRWITCGSRLDVADLMDDTGWDDVVIKPTVSAGSWRTIRVSRQPIRSSDSQFVLDGTRGRAPYDVLARQLLETRDLFVQPFLPSVLDYGEVSGVYLGGTLSHAVRKTVGKTGGWWAHERLGGLNYPLKASDHQLTWMQRVYEALERRYGRLWFGRIDAIHDETGSMRLLECELAIPRLLLPEGQAFGRYADVIARTVKKRVCG
jgi:glutathione synthase/RimK-type ligase-like ATP-grasp enzyme